MEQKVNKRVVFVKVTGYLGGGKAGEHHLIDEGWKEENAIDGYRMHRYQLVVDNVKFIGKAYVSTSKDYDQDIINAFTHSVIKKALDIVR